MRRTSGLSSWRTATRRAICVAALLTAASDATAQTVELTPFGGYRVGGGFFNVPDGRVVNDGFSASYGLLVNVDVGLLTPGLKVEGLFSRQELRVEIRSITLLQPPYSVRIDVDQMQLGGIQEFGDGRARPFLSGLLGLTRYAAPGETEVRFAVGMGSGVKLFATRHIGLRLDARAYVTFVDVNGAGVCGEGCVIGFSVAPSWQGDFTAGLIVAF